MMMMPDGTQDPLCFPAAFPGPFIPLAGCFLFIEISDLQIRDE